MSNPILGSEFVFFTQLAMLEKEMKESITIANHKSVQIIG